MCQVTDWCRAQKTQLASASSTSSTGSPAAATAQNRLMETHSSHSSVEQQQLRRRPLDAMRVMSPASQAGAQRRSGSSLHACTPDACDPLLRHGGGVATDQRHWPE